MGSFIEHRNGRTTQRRGDAVRYGGSRRGVRPAMLARHGISSCRAGRLSDDGSLGNELMTATSPFAPADLPRADFLDRIAAEVHRRVVGQDYMIERLLIGMLTGGHVLFEGLPGLAKTLAVRTLAETIDATFQRIQFTPDLLPADVVGTTI